MKLVNKNKIVSEFKKIPGVGDSIAKDLWRLGLRSLKELKSADAEWMYKDLMSIKGCYVDRCMLYVFRGAVYFVTHSNHDPKLLKWWNWKD